ncbi:hypothetical protein EXN66_Car019633 [Channa argus]|uniref:Uncharacterized protein n=1 Tax=Channa argus TaxID=215402 RepID=A0A6G1QN21_CHAAH|nr:hypothetical protein EXN66_Car019633 [Channa argus]
MFIPILSHTHTHTHTAVAAMQGAHLTHQDQLGVQCLEPQVSLAGSRDQTTAPVARGQLPYQLSYSRPVLLPKEIWQQL